MQGQPPTPGAPRPTFSPDGMWWWDGAQWRPALSPDGRWRWDGRSWVPAQAQRPATHGGAAAAVGITVAIFAGVVVLVALITGVVLYTMGSQISNVFSNVAAALGSTPSP